MNLLLQRLPQHADCTLGGLSVDGRFQAFTLEDINRDVKVIGKTRIPAGTYDVKLRTEGGMHEKYLALYPEHRGMLWLQAVPGFEWVYLHVGNTPENTDGCVLLGDSAQAMGRVSDSVLAYRRVYALVSNAILAGEPTSITVKD